MIADLALAAVNRVERRAGIVLAVFALLTVVASAVVVERFRINTDNEDMLSPDLPFRQNAITETRAFPALSDNLLVAVEGGAGAVARAGDRLRELFLADPDTFGPVYDPAGDPFFRRNGLLFLDIGELDDLGQRLAEAQPLLATLNADPSLSALAAILEGLVRARADGDIETDPASFVAAVAASVEAAAAGEAKPLDWQRLMSGGDADKVARRIIVLRPPLDYGGLDPAGDAVDAVQAIADELAGEGLSARVSITGSPALESEELESVKDGLGFAGLISALTVTILLSVGLGSLWRALAVVVTLAAGLVVTAAFALLIVGPFNLISVAFAVLFVGLGVDFGIHVALRRNRQGPEGVARVGATLFLCLLSTAIGFVAFAFTDYDGLAELGIIAAAGMVIAWTFSLTLLPALIAVLPGAASAVPDERPAARRPALPTRRRAALTLSGAALIGVVAAVGSMDARFDDDPMKLRDPARPAMAAFMHLVDAGEIPAHGASAMVGGAGEERTAVERLEALDGVSAVRTVGDFVPADQDDKLWLIGDMALVLAPSLSPGAADTPSDTPSLDALADLRDTLRATGPADAAYASLAGALDAWLGAGKDPAALERDLLGGFADAVARLRESLEADAFGIEDLPVSITERYIAADGRRRIEIDPAVDTRNSAELDAFVAAVRSVMPDATGAAVIIHEAGKAVVSAFVTAVAIAAVSVAAVLLAWFRRAGPAIACFLPLALAALATTAITHWLGMPFNFANVIVLPLLFGIGVDFAIHVVSEIGSPSGAGDLTRRAIVLSALTTIGSFGGIALSGHPGTASMGYLLTIALIVSVATTLLVTPSIMALLGGGREA